MSNRKEVVRQATILWLCSTVLSAAAICRVAMFCFSLFRTNSIKQSTIYWYASDLWLLFY